MKVGILGGTFDPIHLGHLEAAQAGVTCAGLDQVFLVPAGTPPHKDGAVASGADRLAMCRLAVAGHPQLRVGDWEVSRRGPSYTVDTLRTFHAERPSDEPHLILGWDAAREIRTWHAPDEVLRLARLVVVARPGLANPDRRSLEEAGIDPARVTLCLLGTPDVAATEIRRLSAGSGAIADLVPPSVEAYIKERGLYGASAGRPSAGGGRQGE